jgi:hypothetical protein
MTIDFNDPSLADQVPIHQAIARALIDSVPDAWDAADLQLDWPPDPPGMTDRLFCPDTAEECDVAYEVRLETQKLDDHRDKYGMGWRQATFRIRRDAAGKWGLKVEMLMPKPE